MRKIATVFSGLALMASFGLVNQAHGQQCVDFQGIEHCAIGDARVQANQGALTVDNLGAEGNDGVSSNFDGATFWGARIEFPDRNDPNRQTRMSAVSGNDTTSELILEPTGDGRYRVDATFTGASEESTYSVLVYRDGILQGGLGGFSGSSLTGGEAKRGGVSPSSFDNQANARRIAVYVDGFYMGTIEEPFWWGFWNFSIANNGGCGWGMNLGNEVAISFPDGRNLIGDEIRIEEDVRSSGHYPYLSFNAVETRSSADSFRVTEETAEGGD